MERQYIHLHPSEGYILRAASSVYSGFLATGAVTAGNEDALVTKSVEIAIRMAALVDERILCQDEVD